MIPTSPSLIARTLPLLAVILGANFLILLGYNGAWRASTQVYLDNDDGRRGPFAWSSGLGMPPRPRPDFLSGATAVPGQKEIEAEEGRLAVMETDESSQRSSSSTKKSGLAPSTSPTDTSHDDAGGDAAVEASSRQPDLLAYEDLMERRRARVTSGCSEMRQRGIAPTKNFRNIIVMKEKEVVWCPVFKAASSTWIKYLFETSSLTEVRKGIVHIFPCAFLMFCFAA